MVFPKWSNGLPGLTVAAISLMGLGAIGVVWYYFTPEFWEVGYEPTQPVDYNHQLHAGKLGIDCRYCHTNVEEAGYSNVPDTATCMNCHTGDEASGQAYLNTTLWAAHAENIHLRNVRTAYSTGEPIEWRKVHKLPDYAHFNHAIHINAGVSCYSCHGRVDQQVVLRQVESLSMAWCLECHREPERFVVEASDEVGSGMPKITDLMRVEQTLAASGYAKSTGLELVADRQLHPPEHCGACHY